MPQLLPTPSRGSSQIAVIDRTALVTAFRAKNIVAAFEQPTVAVAVRALGEDTVLIEMTAAITKAFGEYFSESQRMDPALHVSLAETIMEDYPHESVADVVLFIKYAARGRYGEMQDDGTVINKGKTFGRLSTTTAMEWFKQYLGEKADTIAAERAKEIKRLNSTEDDDGNPIIVHDRVLEMMKKVSSERTPEDNDTGRRVHLLLRTVAHMGDDRLRHSWGKAKTERERMVILKEANRRGLVQKKIEQHLNSTTQ
jgi:hypothetical protein